MNHLFPNFLDSADEYVRAETYWRDLWNSLPEFELELYGWKAPWLGPGYAGARDGNPIFSAVSEKSRKGVRVIQFPPQEAGLEFQIWTDTFGGDVGEPDTIVELVIALALSTDSAAIAKQAITSWLSGNVEVGMSLQPTHLAQLVPIGIPRFRTVQLITADLAA